MICVFTCARAAKKPAVCRECGHCPHLCPRRPHIKRHARDIAPSFPTPILHRYQNSK